MRWPVSAARPRYPVLKSAMNACVCRTERRSPAAKFGRARADPKLDVDAMRTLCSELAAGTGDNSSGATHRLSSSAVQEAAKETIRTSTVRKKTVQPAVTARKHDGKSPQRQQVGADAFSC